MPRDVYPTNHELGCAVCLAPKTTSYVRWGSSSCPAGSNKLYTGYAAGSWYDHSGSGYNTLCLHPEPEPLQSSTSDAETYSARVYGTEYESTGYKKNPKENHDALCTVCSLADGAEDVYTQWGRADGCSNGHETLYTGMAMANYYNQQKSEWVCVDNEHATRAGSSNNEGANHWYPTEVSRY